MSFYRTSRKSFPLIILCAAAHDGSTVVRSILGPSQIPLGWFHWRQKHASWNNESYFDRLDRISSEFRDMGCYMARFFRSSSGLIICGSCAAGFADFLRNDLAEYRLHQLSWGSPCLRCALCSGEVYDVLIPRCESCENVAHALELKERAIVHRTLRLPRNC